METYLSASPCNRIPVALSPVGVGLPGKTIDHKILFPALSGLTDKIFFINSQYVDPNNKSATNIVHDFESAFGELAMSKTRINLWDDLETTAALLTAIRDLGGAAVMIPNFTEQIAIAVGLPVFKLLMHGSHEPDHGWGRAWNEDVFLYPWVHTYLQHKPGDWTRALNAMVADLRRFAAGEDIGVVRHDIHQSAAAGIYARCPVISSSGQRGRASYIEPIGQPEAQPLQPRPCDHHAIIGAKCGRRCDERQSVILARQF